MFTGLIEDVGVLKDRQMAGKSGKLEVETELPLEEIELGESIAVNGACLTVEAIDKQTHVVRFHALAETLEKTNLGTVKKGAAVNLERALRVGDRLGGHIVLGHVDTTAVISAVKERAEDIMVGIELPDELRPLVISKGSITVDGISLTIADLEKNMFVVAVIPHTWSFTNLQDAVAGATVNLEADVLGKYIQRQQAVKDGKNDITMSDLMDAGF